jgi:hypothetical protein
MIHAALGTQPLAVFPADILQGRHQHQFFPDVGPEINLLALVGAAFVVKIVPFRGFIAGLDACLCYLRTGLKVPHHFGIKRYARFLEATVAGMHVHPGQTPLKEVVLVHVENRSANRNFVHGKRFHVRGLYRTHRRPDVHRQTVLGNAG